MKTLLMKTLYSTFVWQMGHGCELSHFFLQKDIELHLNYVKKQTLPQH